MKRLLCIVSSMNAGGAETFLMKLYRSLDRARYQMDFCVSEPEKGVYDDEIVSMGGMIHRITPKSKDVDRFKKELFEVVKKGGYKYILRIASNAMAFLDLKIAKRAGAEVCSARSSNSSDGGSLKMKLAHIAGRLLFDRYIDVRIAPSDLAAEYTFGKKRVKNGEVIFLNNGIDLDQYRFDPEARRSVREEFGIPEGVFLLGHVGRFSEQKNHGYLLEIFAEILKRRPDAKLLLIGGGELESSIRDKANELGMKGSVIFAGIRSDVPKLLSAFDAFALPSLYEGMPNVIIEAQAVGVPCIISDTITREANVTGGVKYLPLASAPSVWAEAVLSAEMNRDSASQKLRSAGYDINEAVRVFAHAVFNE